MKKEELSNFEENQQRLLSWDPREKRVLRRREKHCQMLQRGQIRQRRLFVDTALRHIKGSSA